MPNMTAEILIGAYGPFVRVTIDGESLPWEFAVRAAAIRTPMRERYTIASALRYVASKIEARPAALAA